jgi:hypothetical protein
MSGSLGSGYMTTTITPVHLSATDTYGGYIAYSLTGGTLPPNLTLSSTGLLTGTLGSVTVNTTYNFTINASNSIGGHTTQGFAYQILYNAPVWSTSASLGSGYMTSLITPIQLSTTDTYSGNIIYSLTGGSLPPSLTLTPLGTIYGTLGIVSSNTSYNFTITATNVLGGYAAQGFTYQILHESPVWVTSSSLGSGLFGAKKGEMTMLKSLIAAAVLVSAFAFTAAPASAEHYHHRHHHEHHHYHHHHNGM